MCSNCEQLNSLLAKKALYKYVRSTCKPTVLDFGLYQYQEGKKGTQLTRIGIKLNLLEKRL